ncbi:MAG: 2-C-methyl-D-erythritol 2,4-cyclodiphosphate synthase [Deltaproteobacteria bacterium]|jgi:2-C-methyl-D-erythritol 2,4-cyclodiphosphate synthase|nr:2-C-methyl-D-erythritol 2,4-cyclodiphosphate synthase [Deltaproteobacteria bacterium]
MTIRIGIGYDIHKLVEGRKLVLGGMEIPFERGLKGHSDGDALLHAISDAMLGALALGDIGKHFPDTDPKYKDADSKMLLGEVLDKITCKGWKLINIDANIIAQAPKMAMHIEMMRKTISEILSLPIDCISIKARTNEELDSLGKGEAIAVQTAVLVEKS